MSNTPDLDKAREAKTHTCDDALGSIHEMAIGLQLAGCASAALTLASAHEQIQQYLIDEERRMLLERAEEAERCAAESGKVAVGALKGGLSSGPAELCRNASIKRAAELRRQAAEGGGK